jgi:hypothetical protein
MNPHVSTVLSENLLQAAAWGMSAHLPPGLSCTVDWISCNKPLAWKSPDASILPVFLGCSGTGIPTIRFTIGGEDPRALMQLARDGAYSKNVSDIVDKLVPIGVGFVLCYSLLLDGTRKSVELARIGELHIGATVVFQEEYEMGHMETSNGTPNSLIEQIIFFVRDKCSSEGASWEEEFRSWLKQILQEPFTDGQVLTAKYLNRVETRLKFLEERVADIRGENPPDSERTFVLGGKK